MWRGKTAFTQVIRSGYVEGGNGGKWPPRNSLELVEGEANLAELQGVMHATVHRV